MFDFSFKFKNTGLFLGVWMVISLHLGHAVTVDSVSVPEYTNQSISSLDIIFNGAVDSSEAKDASAYELYDITRDQVFYHNVAFDSINGKTTLTPQLNLPYNLNSWQAFRYPDPRDHNGNIAVWNTDASGQSVTQTINADPSFFYSDGSFLGEKVIFTLRTTDSDDDFMGFFFGYSHNPSAPFDSYYLFTWNNGDKDGVKNATYMPNSSAHLIKVTDMFGASSADAGALFGQMNVDADSRIERLQMEVNGAWQRNVDYVAVLEYDFDVTDTDAIRIKIKIYSESEYLNNGVPLYDWDIVDSNNPLVGGQIGFFNQSQARVTYQQVAETTVLAEGDYRLTIRGGSDGITALDGNSDGNIGDDFIYNFKVDQTPPILDSVSSGQASILLSFVDASPLILNPSAVASDGLVIASGGDGSFDDGNEINVTGSLTGISLLEDQKTVKLLFGGGLPPDYYEVSLSNSSVLTDEAGNEVDLAVFPIVHRHNNPPEVVPLSESFYEGIRTDFSVSATDADGDNVSIMVVSMPEGVIDNGAGSFSWTPSEAQGGQSFALEVLFSDDGDPSQSVLHTFNLQVVEIIEFAEPLILDTILTALGESDGYIVTASDLANLTGTLDLSDLDIADLTGLQYLTGITGLNLSDNQISDLSSIENLTNLTSLNLDSNRLDLSENSEDLAMLTVLTGAGVSVSTLNQETYTITYSVSDPSGGSISLQPEKSDYYYGEAVTVTLDLAVNYYFEGWSGDLPNKDISQGFVITADSNLVASVSAINFNLQDLQGWFRPEQLSLDYADGEKVGDWRDYLGVHTLSVTTDSQKPVYREGLLGGYGGLDFDNTDDCLYGSYDHLLSSNSLTISVVYAQKSLSGNMRVVSSQDNYFFMGARDNRYRAYYGSSNWLSDAEREVFEPNRFIVHTYRYDSSTGKMEHWVNGRLLGSLTGSLAHRRIGLGECNYNEELNGYVSELLIYEKALSDTEIGELEVYLADKYKLYHPDATWINEYTEREQSIIRENRYDQSEADTVFQLQSEFPEVSDTIVSGLKRWFRPEQLSLDYADGEIVGDWRDYLGVHTLSVTSDSQKPVYREGLLEGYGGLDFDNSDDRLYGSYDHAVSSDSLTISVVYAQKSQSGNMRVVSSHNNYFFMGARDDSYRAHTNSWLNSSDPEVFEPGRFVVHTYRYDGNTGKSEHWVNGRLLGSRTSAFTHRNIGLGEVYSTYSEELNGYVSELLIYEKALSDDEIDELQVYLADKYKLYHPDAEWINEYTEREQSIIRENRYDQSEADTVFQLQSEFPEVSDTIVSGLKRWFRPEQLSLDYADGEIVGDWRDYLGVHTLSVTSDSQKPVYREGLLEGYGGLDFDNSDDRLYGSYDHAVSSDSLTISVVYAQKSQSGNMRVVSSHNNYFFMGARDDSYRAHTNSWLNSSDPEVFEPGRFVVHTYRYDGNTGKSEHWVNGRLLGSRTSAFTHRNIGLGEVYSTYSEELNGYVSELLIYEKALSDTEIGELGVYLADKYKLYHPNAAWIMSFDENSRVLIHQNRLARDQFVADYGAYAPDAGWINSYSTGQQAYIHAHALNLADVPVLPGSLQSAYGLEQGLKLFMPLRSTTTDVSGYAWSITEKGTLPETTDRFGNPNQAYRFDSGSIEIEPAMTPEDQVTVSVWVNTFDRTPPEENGEGELVSGFDGATDNNETFRLIVGNESYHFRIYDRDGSTVYTSSFPEVITENTWSHLVGRFDGASMQALVDLVSAPANTDYSDGLTLNGNATSIGAALDGSRNFHGALNDVMIWDRALSDEELELLYFIQLDQNMAASLQGLISGQAPAPAIASISQADTLLAEGDLINLEGAWIVNFDISYALDRVELFLDDILVGEFRGTGTSYSFNQDFAVSAGLHTVKVVAYNIDGLSDTYSLELNFSGNTAPYFDPVPVDEAIEEDQSWNLLLNGGDVDVWQTTSLSLVSGPDGLVFNETLSQLTWQPGESEGGATYPVTVEITDNGFPKLTTQVTFNLRVVEVVDFVDPLLEAALLALPEFARKTYLTEDDLGSLTGTLDLSGLGISDLTGLEYLTGITDLNLSGNTIIDLSPLAGLTQLTTLDLSNNQIYGPSPLSGLTNLSTLDLSQNRLDLDTGDPDLAIIQGFPLSTTVLTDGQERYTLQVSINGPGTVTVAPDQDDYGYGDQLTLTAIKDESYHLFKGWSGDAAGNASPLNLTINSNQLVNAEFTAGVPDGTGDGLIWDTYYYNGAQPWPQSWPSLEDSFRGTGYRFILSSDLYVDGSPVTAKGNDWFVFRLKGQIEAKYSTLYTFIGKADDQFEVYLNGDLIIKNQSYSEYSSQPVELVAGQLYDLEIRFREFYGPQFIYLDWQPEGGVRQRIPRSQLYSGTSGVGFASPVVANYFDVEGNSIDVSGTNLEYGVGTLPLNAQVELTAGAGETIRYTLDGLEPTASSQLYTQPLIISSNTTLKARAFSSTADEGAVFTGIYVTDDSPPLLTDLQLPNVEAPDGVSSDTLLVGDTNNRMISINAEDDTEVTSVDFYLTRTDENNTVFLGSDETGVAEATGARFAVPFNIFDFADGNWNLQIVATDRFGAEATLSQPITIGIAAPPAPVISKPVNGAGFAQGQLTISGSARIDASVEVQVRRVNSAGNPLAGTDGTFAALGAPVAVNSAGQFSLAHTFADTVNGERYQLRVLAIGRNAVPGAFSPTIEFTVDSSIPPTPINLSVKAEAGGDIRISWAAPQPYSRIIASYRIEVSEDNGASWTQIAQVPGTTYTYLYRNSEQSGTPPFIFRVIAVNTAGTITLAEEAQVTAAIEPDSAAPQIISLEWIPQTAGQYDADNAKYGTGLLTVQFEVNEAVSGLPYFALKPPGLGLPYQLDLIAIDDRRFEAVFPVEDDLPSGTYQIFAVLTDLAGNRSDSNDAANLPFVAEVDTSLVIDTTPPLVENLVPANQAVFKNEGSVLSFTFTFDEDLLAGFEPLAIAQWGDDTFVNPEDVTLQNLGSGSWQIDVALDTADGYDGSNPDPNPDIEQVRVNNSMLTLLLEVEDTVGNAGFAELPSVLIYRNTLPWTAPPVLSAEVLPGGEILLEWSDVPEADRYQLVRVDSPDEVLTVVPRDSENATATYVYAWTAPQDGTYYFYVAGEREDPLSPGTYITGYSLEPLEVISDSSAPTPPELVDIADVVPNSVLRVDWQQPNPEDVQHFDVYRATVNPFGSQEVDPSWTQIRENLAPSTRSIFDSKPYAGLAWYVIVAVDAVGNEALAANFPSRDISVVPPAEVTITLAEDSFPVLSWSEVTAVTQGGSYSVYYQEGSDWVELASDLTNLSFTDNTWNGQARTYRIESVKEGTTASRDIVLPEYELNLQAGTTLYRGIAAPVRLQQVPSATIFNYRLRIGKSGVDSSSFFIGGLNESSVAFGLAPDGSTNATQDVVVQIELTPRLDQDFGEKVIYEIERTLPVEDRLPVMSLTAGALSRGATVSTIEWSIANPSESDLQVQLSKGYVALRLYDTAGNLLAENRLTGESDRTILGGETSNISGLSINVPQNAPETVILQAELSQYRNPQTGQSFIPQSPLTSRLSLSTVALSYSAEITAPKAVDSASLLTSGSIEITGRAIGVGGAPRAAALVTLGLENGNFKRTYSLVTDSQGRFSYIFDPDGSQPGGAYTVWAKHPELTLKPTDPAALGAFIYKNISISPPSYNVRIPRNYVQGVPLIVKWPAEVTLTQFALEVVRFGDQPLPDDLEVTIPTIADPASGSTSLKIVPEILPKVAPDAEDEINLLFRVSAVIDGAAEPTVLGEVPAYCFFTPTFGQLIGPAKKVDLGVLREVDGETTTIYDDSATFSFTNTGLIPLTGLQVDVMQPIFSGNDVVGYEPAPRWLKLVGTPPGILEVGRSMTFQLTSDLASEANLPSDGEYPNYVIRARSNEAPPANASIYLNLTSDTDSTLNVHVVNAYFGFDASTLPDGGAGISIPTATLETYEDGVPGATITLQQDSLDTTSDFQLPLIYRGVTGADGKVDMWRNQATGVESTSLPAGRYQMVVKAPKHDSYSKLVVVKPGVNTFEQALLSYGAVTVEWEVREITLQDRYEVTIETTFETEVPAPVVTVTPAVINLPAMCPGDVYEVELLYENHGIISALNLDNPIPQSDEFLRIEPLVEIGETFDLPAKQTYRVAYRCIAKKALPGAACDSPPTPDRPIPYKLPVPTGCYSKCKTSTYEYICPWNPSLNYSGSVRHCLGVCHSIGGSGGSSGGGFLGGGGGGGGGGGSGFTRRSSSVSLGCVPPRAKKGFCDDTSQGSTSGLGGLAQGVISSLEQTGSEVDLWGLTYLDGYTDLQISVPGGSARVSRTYSEGSWRMNSTEPIKPMSADAQGRSRVSLSGVIFTKTNNGRPGYANLGLDSTGTFVSENGDILEYTYASEGTRWYDNQMKLVLRNGSWFGFSGDPNNGALLTSAGRETQTRLVYDRELSQLDPASPFEQVFSVKRVLSGIDVDVSGDPIVLLYYNYASDYAFSGKSWPLLESVTTYNTNLVTTPDPESGQVGVFYEYYLGADGDPDTGLLKSVIKPDGRKSVYIYDDQRSLISKAEYDSDGTTLLHTVNVEYQPTQLTAADAIITQSMLGAPGGAPRPVASVTDGAGITKRFAGTYNSSTGGYYSKIIYSNGLIKEVWFDADQRPVQESLDGEVIQSVARVGRIERVTTRGNSVTIREYDEFDNVIRETLPNGEVHSWTYEPVLNRMTSEIDAEGTQITYIYYDADWGTDTNSIAYNADPYFATRSVKVVESGDDLSRTRWEYYDKLDRVVLESDWRGHQTAYYYKENTNLIIKATRPDVIDATTGQPFVLHTQTYDDVGYLESYTDAAGGVTYFDYNASGLLLSMTNDFGVSVVHTYYGDDLIETEVGRIGNPGDANYQRGRITRYTLDGEGRRLTEARVDEEGVEHIYMHYAYNSLGQLVQTTNADGLISTYTYDKYGNQTSSSIPLPDARDAAIDQTNAVSYQKWNAFGDLLEQTSASGLVRTYTYDKLGRALSVTEGVGTDDERSISFRYDSRTNVTETSFNFSDSTTGVVRTTYDAFNRLTARSGYGVYPETYTYDANDNLTSVTDARGLVTTYTYDKFDRLYQVFEDGTLVATHYYDVNGNLVEQIDAEGIHTHWVYDSLNRPLYESTPGYTAKPDQWWTDFANVQLQNTYNRFGEIETVRSAYGQETTNTYDGFGRLKSITYPTGATVRYEFTATDLPKRIQFPVVSTSGQGLGSEVVYTYDAANPSIVTSVKQRSGEIVQNYYDEALRLTRVDTPTGSVRTMKYDSFDRLISETDYASSADFQAGQSYRTTQYTNYDDFDRLLELTLPGNNGIQTMEYDNKGNMIKRSGAQTFPVEYTYDAVGNLETMTTFYGDHDIAAADTSVTRWEYDLRGRLERKIYADGSDVDYTYYKNNRLYTRTNAREQITTYTYDAWGNVDLVDYPVGQTDIDYEYTKGRLDSMIDAGGSTTWTYHPNSGLPASETRTTLDADPTTIAWQYDNEGRRIQMTVNGLPGESQPWQTVYNYDRYGRLELLQDNRAHGTKTFAYGYHPTSGLLERIDSPWQQAAGDNYLGEQRSYDSFGRLKSRQLNTSAVTPAPIIGVNSIQYDVLDRHTSVSLFGGVLYAGQKTRAYDYDNFGQLKEQSTLVDDVAEIDHTYEYDAIGNRLNWWQGDPIDPAAALDTYVPNNLNQYNSFTRNNSVETVPVYDTDGNLEQQDGWTYTWDTENRLVAAEQPGVQRIEYTYDGSGRRVSKQVYEWDLNSISWLQTSHFFYVYDGWNLLAEFEVQGSKFEVRSSYTWGLDLSVSLQGAGGIGGLLAVVHNDNGANTSYMAAYDFNGNIIGYVDPASETLVAEYEYDPYGQTVTSSGPLKDVFNFRFSTKYFDAETELYYYGFRYYDSETGRWLNRDPIEEDGGLNLYGMVGNNPIMYVDPTGESSVAANALQIGMDMLLNPIDSLHEAAIIAQDAAEAMYEAAVDKVRDFICSPGFQKFLNHPAVVRTLGVLQVVGGLVEVGIGIALTKTGIGALVGVPVIVMGLDNIQAGFRTAATGQYTDTFLNQGLQAMGLSPLQAAGVELGLGFLTGGIGGIAKGLGKVGTMGRAVGKASKLTKNLQKGSRLCFVAGTQVKTDKGFKNIEDIEIGDRVWSKSDTNTGEQGFKPVVNLFKTAPTQLVHLTYRTKGHRTHSSQKKKTASGGSNDDDSDSSSSTLIGTKEHPFWSIDARDWVPMGELEVGDTLVLSNGTQVVVEATRVENAKDGEHFATYNFEVADWHTYYVAPGGETELESAVWVHNKGSICSPGLARAQQKYSNLVEKYGKAAGEGFIKRLKSRGLASGDDIHSIRAANRLKTGGTRANYNKQTGQGLYALIDDAGSVRYIGRGDAPVRLLKHASSKDLGGFRQVILRNNDLTKAQAKGLENYLIGRFGGAKSMNELTNLFNRIRSFARTNGNARSYKNAATNDLIEEVMGKINKARESAKSL